MFTEKREKSTVKTPTKARLRNVALHYLERFESSEEKLRKILRQRIDKYAFINKEYKKEQAYQWVEEIVQECAEKNYVNDKRFADFKIKDYLSAGKSKRYIEQKLKQKGIDEQTVSDIFETAEYSELDTALAFAKKKKMGRYRENEASQKENRQKDLAALVRAGFDYDIAKKVIEMKDE